jgi:hypothetical protein
MVMLGKEVSIATGRNMAHVDLATGYGTFDDEPDDKGVVIVGLKCDRGHLFNLWITGEVGAARWFIAIDEDTQAERILKEKDVVL